MFAQLQLLPEQASTYAVAMDALLYYLVGTSAFFSLLIAVLIFTFAIRYRRRSEAERPPAVHCSMKLELVWTLIPFVLMMTFFGWGAQLYFSWARPPDDT